MEVIFESNKLAFNIFLLGFISFFLRLLCLILHLMAGVLGNALARKAQLRRDPKTKMVEWNML